MFKQRFFTAIILIPLVLLIIYSANSWVLSFAILGLFLALSWEWFGLIVIEKPVYKFISIIALLALFTLNLHYWDLFLKIDLVLWGLIIAAIVTYPWSLKFWGNPYVVSVVSSLVLTTFLSILFVFILEDEEADYLVYLLCLVWATDIGAYLFGKKFGKRKLIPEVSPGKTIEGTFGGLFLSLLVACVGYWYFTASNPVFWFSNAFITTIVSIFGDLFISMLKRRCHVKDTGHILPGHGGVLDRLDSLIAALPVFYFLQIASQVV